MEFLEMKEGERKIVQDKLAENKRTKKDDSSKGRRS